MAERSFSCMWSKDGAVKKHKRWSDGSAVFAGGVFTVTDGDDNKVTSTRLQQAEAAACLKPDAEFRAGSVAVQILREHQGVQAAAPASTAAASAASAACAAALPVPESTGTTAAGGSGSSGVIGVKRTLLGQLNRSSSGGGSSSSSSSTLLSKGPRKPFVTPRASSISVKRVGTVPSAAALSSSKPILSRPAAASGSYAPAAAAAAASRPTADNDDDAAMVDSDGETQCQTTQQQKKALTASQPATMKAPTVPAPSQQQQQQQQQANSEDLVLETRSGQVLKLGMLLARQMKQHQRDGVQFMWSVLAAGGGHAQRGCILADEVSTIYSLRFSERLCIILGLIGNIAMRRQHSTKQ
jgi:Protein of unknown function (DUF2439)